LWFKDSYSLVFNNKKTKIKKVSDLKKLKDEVFVFFNKDYAPAYHSSLIEICAHYGFIPNVVHESNNINSIIQLVKNGLGISIVPTSLKKSHKYTELSFLDLKSNFATDVLLAKPKNEESEITDAVMEYLLK
jgi:DNA-binding transcriptional LysR family regulator